MKINLKAMYEYENKKKEDGSSIFTSIKLVFKSVKWGKKEFSNDEYILLTYTGVISKNVKIKIHKNGKIWDDTPFPIFTIELEVHYYLRRLIKKFKVKDDQN